MSSSRTWTLSIATIRLSNSPNFSRIFPISVVLSRFPTLTLKIKLSIKDTTAHSCKSVGQVYIVVCAWVLNRRFLVSLSSFKGCRKASLNWQCYAWCTLGNVEWLPVAPRTALEKYIHTGCMRLAADNSPLLRSQERREIPKEQQLGP